MQMHALTSNHVNARRARVAQEKARAFDNVASFVDAFDYVASTDFDEIEIDELRDAIARDCEAHSRD